MNKFCKTILMMAAGLGMGSACSQVDFERERQALIKELREQSSQSDKYGTPALSERVLKVLGEVPRHEFVPENMQRFAYHNRPLPIGAGQTISQPLIVALMTDLADVSADEVVLEVGTGSGYQAAVLGELAAHVYTIEIVDMLGRRAAQTLERLGYDNVTVRVGDGYAGWPDKAPFDAIVVTAAPEEIPQPLIEQLSVGGRLVIPVGEQHRVQTLQVLIKKEDGSLHSRDIIAVRFVPFTRED